MILSSSDIGLLGPETVVWTVIIFVKYSYLFHFLFLLSVLWVNLHYT